MRTTTFRVAAVAAAAALTLAACGDDGGDAETTADSPAAESEESTAGGGGEGDGLTIGIKYDQPGLGIMEGDTPTGMDVDVAKAVADRDRPVDAEALRRAGLAGAVEVSPGVWHLVAGLEAEQYAEGMRRRLASVAAAV